MKKYKIDLYTPECTSNTNGGIDIIDLTDNKNLSITWKNLPPDAKVTNHGKTVSNLGCGLYEVNIYDIDNKQDYIESIEIECPDILSIDLVQIDGLYCKNDIGDLNIMWSGGKSPYAVSINGKNITTNDNNIVDEIKADHTYDITIKDSLGCMVERKNISKKIDYLKVELQWEPIKYNGGTSENVECTISGGKAPYSIAWFIQDDSKPIVVNKNSIKNKLKSNYYTLIVTDSNNCKIYKDFFISEPSNILVNTKISADYRSESYFPEETTQKLYNLLLIPLEKNKIKDFHKKLKSNKIVLEHKKQKTEQNIVLDFDTVSIDGLDYMYFYISPGLTRISQATSVLSIGDEDITLYHDTTFNNQNKLLIGSIILDKNYEYLFHNDDIVSLTDTKTDKSITETIRYSYTTSGLYISPNISTIINFLPNNPEQVLNFLNKSKQIDIRCLTTKSNNNLGEIYLYVAGGDKNSLKAELIDKDDNKSYYDIKDNYLRINDLTHGDYKIKVYDRYIYAIEYNKTNINSEYYAFTILKSFKEEQQYSQAMMSKTYDIPIESLNTYDKTPSKLLFTSPEFTNGVLINISPSEACYEIIDDDGNKIDGCGYGIVELDYGKYSIESWHEGYLSKKQEFFINKSKDLVTIILEKEPNGFY